MAMLVEKRGVTWGQYSCSVILTTCSLYSTRLQASIVPCVNIVVNCGVCSYHAVHYIGIISLIYISMCKLIGVGNEAVVPVASVR